MDLTRVLNRIPRRVMLAAGIVSVPILGLIDYATGYEAAFSIFYALPVMLISWYVSGSAGFLVSLLSAAAWTTADQLAGHKYTSSWFILWNSVIPFGFFVLINHLLSRLKMAHEKQVNLARMDPLTGCDNRRFFLEKMETEIARSARYRRPVTLAYIDLDGFKQVNDAFGHHQGDQVLKQVGELLRHNARKTDVIARVGGDEFVVVLPEDPFPDAGEFLRRMQQQLRNLAEHNRWLITFSVGAVTHPHPDSADQLLKLADLLLYQAKAAGKDRLVHRQATIGDGQLSAGL